MAKKSSFLLAGDDVALESYASLDAAKKAAEDIAEAGSNKFYIIDEVTDRVVAVGRPPETVSRLVWRDIS